MAKAKTDPVSREDVNKMLLTLGRAEQAFLDTKARMDKQINRAKAQWRPVLERRSAAIAAQAQTLRLACEDSREVLLPSVPRSMALLFGTVGFRRQGVKVTWPKDDAAGVVSRLRVHARADLVRTREEPDKRAIREAGLDPRTLRALGITLVPAGEDFFYKVDRAKVAEAQEPPGDA